MSYQQYIFTLIARLGGSKDKAVVDPTLCRFMGDLQGGVFLSQLLYWSDKGRNGEFYKTYREWEAEIFLSKYEVNKAAKKCVEMGFLTTRVKKANGNPTVHYRILPERFLERILAFVEKESQIFDKPMESENFDFPKAKNAPSITETTTTQTSAKSRVRPTQGRKVSARRSYNPADYDFDQ